MSGNHFQHRLSVSFVPSIRASWESPVSSLDGMDPEPMAVREQMNRWLMIGVWCGWVFLGASCKNESLQAMRPVEHPPAAAATPAPVDSKAVDPSIQVAVAGATPKASPRVTPAVVESHEWKEALQLAFRERREHTLKYREMTVDSMTVVVRCGEALKISSVGANLDTPYNNPKGFVVVAESTAEAMLQNHTDQPGCAIADVLYWARDEDGQSDIVVRFGVNAGSPSTLWRVFDTGSFERVDPEQLPVRFFSDRLIRVASFFAEVSDEPDRAVAHIRAAEALDPKNVRVAGVKAEILAKSLPDDAINHLTDFMAKNGENAGLLGTLATLYLEKGTEEDKVKADQVINKAMALDATNFKALAAKAERQRDLGDFAGAIATYLALDKVDPLNNTFRYNLAILYLETNQTTEALAQLDRFLREFPEDLDALYLRAVQKLRLGDHEGAQRDVDIMLKVAPESPEVAQFGETVKRARAEANAGPPVVPPSP